eukprot:9500694-Pyramimonas_sp.AAC.1
MENSKNLSGLYCSRRKSLTTMFMKQPSKVGSRPAGSAALRTFSRVPARADVPLANVCSAVPLSRVCNRRRLAIKVFNMDDQQKEQQSLQLKYNARAEALGAELGAWLSDKAQQEACSVPFVKPRDRVGTQASDAPLVR